MYGLDNELMCLPKLVKVSDSGIETLTLSMYRTLPIRSVL
jgi:hypothetical protein